MGYPLGFLVISLSSVAGLAQERGERSAESADALLRSVSVRKEAWQKMSACGPNCLYVFLRLNGAPVGHADVIGAVPVTDQGCSMREMNRYANKVGFGTQVVHTNPRHLDQVPLPAIAHLGEGPNDHFVILCRVVGNQVEVVDGTTGAMLTVDRGTFEKDWTGYLLIKAPRWWDDTRSWSLLSVAGALLVAGVYRGARRGGAIVPGAPPPRAGAAPGEGTTGNTSLFDG